MTAENNIPTTREFLLECAKFDRFVAKYYFGNVYPDKNEVAFYRDAVCELLNALYEIRYAQKVSFEIKRLWAEGDARDEQTLLDDILTDK